MIEAENLTVERSGKKILDGVSLRIEAGQCVSIIGPNGAGKSTLMSALLGLADGATGMVRLDSQPLAKISRRQIARRIAYVPQFHEGYLGFNVRDVIEAGRYAHLDPLAPLADDDRQAVSDAVRDCHVGDLLERSVHTLSGGERQKVWIAAALAQQAPALFLDEPTNALDPAHQADLIGIMRRCLERGNTLLVICHDLNLPLALGGRIVAMKHGKIVHDGQVASLFDLARLREIFSTEFEIYRASNDERKSIQLKV